MANLYLLHIQFSNDANAPGPEYMGISVKDEFKDLSFTAEITNKFRAEYHICQCENGKPSLRCVDPINQFCDPDECNTNYKYKLESKSCVENECWCENGTPAKLCRSEDIQACDPSGCNTASESASGITYVYDEASEKCVKPSFITDFIKPPTCNSTQHYVENTNSCETNVCYCSYGEVHSKCTEHKNHVCKLNTCKNGTEPIQGDDGTECSKKCENVLFMDSTWFQPLGAPGDIKNIYWQHVTSDQTNIGYTFFEALSYCQSKGTYVSLPSNPEFFQEIFDHTGSDTWIGLSKFGDVPNQHRRLSISQA